MFGRHGRAAGLLVMVGKEVGVGHRAGQRRGAGVGSPEGCFTITVRRHGARMYSMCVSERYFKKNWMRGLGGSGRSTRRVGAEEWLFGSGLRIWWSHTWC